VICGARVGEIRTIMWANPANAGESIIEWICAGCEPEQHRTLGHDDLGE